MKLMKWLLAAVLVAAGHGLAHADPKRIEIASFGEHPALNQVAEGFKTRMTELGYVEGKDVSYGFQHANFDRSLVPQILQQVEAKHPALILAITTGLNQAAVRGITDKSIPVVFGAVVDPVVAGIVPDWQHGSAWSSGASMLPDFDASFDYLKKVLPGVKKVGTLFNPGEDNDTSNMELIQKAAVKAGIEVVGVPVDNPNDLPQRVQTFAGQVDAIFLIQSGDAPEGEEAELLAERRELLITIAALPEAEMRRQQVEQAAAEGGVPLDAVYGMLRAMGAEAPEDPAQLGMVLRKEAGRFARTLAEREVVDSPDPEIVRLSALADQAESEGLLSSANSFRERAKARFLQLEPTLAAQQAALDQRYIEGAAVFARSAATKELVMNWVAAADDYAEAFRLVERREARLALRYKLKETSVRGLDFIFSPFDEKTSYDVVTAAGVTVELARRVGEQQPLVESLNLYAQTLQTLSRQEAEAGKAAGSKATLERAVGSYRSALSMITPQSAPDLWVQTQTNLALAFHGSADRAENRADSLRQATLAYRDALQALQPGDVGWSKLQIDLSGVLREHARYDDDPLLFEEAADVYRAMLRQPATNEADIREHANARRELSAILIELSQRYGDRAPLDEAVALHRRTRAELPPDRFDALLNEELLGAALEERANLLGDVDEAVRDREAAIEAYRAAAAGYSYEYSPLGWAQRQAALGDALYALGSRETGTLRLEAAVTAYRAALVEYTRERVPHGWAIYQVSLGNALLALGINEGGTARLEEAAVAYRLALQEQTRERAPLDRAMTQSNLGFTLTLVGEAENNLSRFEEAASVLREALAAQRELASPDTHYTESDLCRALMDIGESNLDRATLLEAHALCETAVAGLMPYDKAAAEEAAENQRQVKEALAALK